MKFKDLLIPVAFALATTWLIQYAFFRNTDKEGIADRSFVAPVSAQVAEPLSFEIDFSDAKPTQERALTQVTTQYGFLEFSNYGAVINRMAYKRLLAGQEALIETVMPTDNKERGAFLLALDADKLGATPYYYTLTDNKTENGVTTLTYKAQSNRAVVTKQFSIYPDSYKVDLKITVEPVNKQEGARARLFFPAPFMNSADFTDTVSAVLYSEKKALEKKQLAAVKQLGKERPSIFGLEDRYFANILIKDAQAFASRAYFKVEAEAVNPALTAQAVLQTTTIYEPTTWELSFYCGPKEMVALSKVDPRLEGILDYGWFSLFAKALLYLLNFFYELFKNYGVAIIAVTLLIRLLMVPLTLKGEQSRRKQMEAQRKLQYIEQKYKHDPELLAKEKAEFARKHGIPGMLGCLPLLLQIPVFIGLQRVLANAIELYKAPFLWIPDLSAADPYYILPVLVGIGMMLQTAQTGDPRQGVSNILIAMIVAAVTINISAGLALFIAVSTLLGVAQTYIQKALNV